MCILSILLHLFLFAVKTATFLWLTQDVAHKCMFCLIGHYGRVNGFVRRISELHVALNLTLYVYMVVKCSIAKPNGRYSITQLHFFVHAS